jgi:ABC-type bacteriocin/lantibiotic exporter with double-glycine peptidase domain
VIRAAPERAGSAPRFQSLLLSSLLGERELLTKLGAVSLVGGLLALGVPQLSRMTMDEALPTTSPRMLLALSAGAVLIGAHQAWAGWIEDRSSTALGARVERSSLDTLFGSFLASDYALLRKRDAGWMGDTLGGASGVVYGYVSTFVTFVTQGAFTLAYLGLLLSESVLATLLVLLASAGIAGLSWAFARWESKLAKIALDASSRQQELLNVLLASLASLRGLFCTRRLGAEWTESLQTATVTATQRARASTLRTLVVSGAGRALGIAITTWSIYACVSSHLGIGEMMMLSSIAAGLSASLLAISGAWLSFRTLEPQFERVNELLAAAPARRSEPAPGAQTNDAIVLEGVWQRYSDDGRWILEDRSFRVERNSFTRLDAPSGSGKSTLLRVLAGLLAPSRGRVSIFGLDARAARHLVLYVPQHCNLLEASIGENLRLLSGASDEEIQRVAELTGLSELLATLPMGVETPVAARGHNLSSGQRQLVILTAAFASQRPVLLLDESLSQIDVRTRRRMQWPALLHNRTVIAVEHARG